ncbi:hypothetical protein [Burkholderia metallica]|uniref:hypothetical protein n=1 Tax=Burkholderia metallica TaxID=488729 RepID=UPI001F5B91DC|nr:hypothetical protein [Burkholderia metallica]
MNHPTLAVFTLDALIDTCARFDSSDRDQRLIVRTLVVPMLARRLKWLRLLLHASPRSEATRMLVEQVERALACASTRLDEVGSAPAAAPPAPAPRRRQPLSRQAARPLPADE